MSKKLLAVAITTLMLTGACQSDYVDIPSSDPTSDTKAISRSTGFTFPDGWQYLETNDERWAALQIPEDMLSTMSTEDLVEACMNYPLALDCFAFNDVQYGISEVISRFNGFAELKQREDAFDKVLDFYGRNLEEIEILGNTAGYTFKPLSLSFYERFIASGYLLPIEELKNSDKLINIYYKAIEIHNSFDELQGHSLTESFSSLTEVIRPGQRSLDNSTKKKITIYTSKGRPVIAYQINCKSSSYDKIQGENFVKSSFPDVTIVSEGTCTYNCHAYAWYVSEGGSKCWIDGTYDDKPNIANFFTDGTYIETTNPQGGDKVYYKNGDHSAVVYSGDVFTSKWGQLPLVRHKYNRCPYNSTNLVYYKLHNISGIVQWDKNPDPTPMGSSENFYINKNFDSSRYRVNIFISSAKDESEPLEDDSRAYIESFTSSSAVVYFAKPGNYYVNFWIYEISTGEKIGEYTSDIILVV